MSERLKRFHDPQTTGIVLLTFLVLVESLQVLILIVFIFSFIPIQPNAVFYTIYPSIRDTLHPERDLFFYKIFIFLSMAMEAAGLYFFRNHLKSPEFQKELRRFLAAEIFWLGLQSFAIFKIMLYEKQMWAR